MFDTMHMLQCHCNHVSLLRPCNNTFMQAIAFNLCHCFAFHVYAVLVYHHERQFNDN